MNPSVSVGRGEVIEGQVWSLRGTSTPMEAEVLKTFSSWGKTHYEPVLMLRWSREMPAPDLIKNLTADVFQLTRKDLERDWELIAGPRTDLLRQAVATHAAVTSGPNE